MELEIVKFFNQLGAGWIDPATVFISSNTLIGILGIIITAYFLIYDKKNGKRIAVAAAIAVGLHFLVSEIFFKYVLPDFGLFRLRPYLAHPGEIVPLGKLNESSSFPSSHMAYTLSLLTVYVYYYGAVGENKVSAEPKLLVKKPPRYFATKLRNWVYYRKYWPLALGFALFMAFARMHNGMHYPGDVVAGAGLGVFYGMMAIKYSGKFFR